MTTPKSEVPESRNLQLVKIQHGELANRQTPYSDALERILVVVLEFIESDFDILSHSPNDFNAKLALASIRNVIVGNPGEHRLSRPREQNGEEAMEGLKAKLEKRMAELREMQRKGENDTVVQLAECYWVLKFVNSHRSPSPQSKEMEEAIRDVIAAEESFWKDWGDAGLKPEADWLHKAIEKLAILSRQPQKEEE